MRGKKCHPPRTTTPSQHETQTIPARYQNPFLSTFFAYTIGSTVSRARRQGAGGKVPMAETIVLLLILVALWSIAGFKARGKR